MCAFGILTTTVARRAYLCPPPFYCRSLVRAHEAPTAWQRSLRTTTPTDQPKKSWTGAEPAASQHRVTTAALSLVELEDASLEVEAREDRVREWAELTELNESRYGNRDP